MARKYDVFEAIGAARNVMHESAQVHDLLERVEKLDHAMQELEDKGVITLVPARVEYNGEDCVPVPLADWKQLVAAWLATGNRVSENADA